MSLVGIKSNPFRRLQVYFIVSIENSGQTDNFSFTFSSQLFLIKEFHHEVAIKINFHKLVEKKSFF